jgi:hypothetical protein
MIYSLNESLETNRCLASALDTGQRFRSTERDLACLSGIGRSAWLSQDFVS